jgi:hypothetical protein
MTYNPSNINLFNIDMNDEECIICKECLSNEDTYKLPECCHVYHTKCIVTWFRNENNACPHCGNKGINNYQKEQYYYQRNYKSNPIYNDLKKYAYSKKELNTNEEETRLKLKKYFDKIKNMECNVKNIKNELKEYKKIIKNQEVDYYKCKKNLDNYRSRIYSIGRDIASNIRKMLYHNYIVPLIIPLKVQVN